MNKVQIAAILSFFILFSCGKKETEKKEPEPGKPDGGPCSYRYDTIPYKISRIIYSKDSTVDLELTHVNSCEGDSLGCETFYYAQEIDWIKLAEFEKTGLKKGDSICFVSGQIVSGHCNPDNSYLTLIKY